MFMLLGCFLTGTQLTFLWCDSITLFQTNWTTLYEPRFEQGGKGVAGRQTISDRMG